MSDRSIEATLRLSYAGLQNDVNAVNDIIKSVTTNLASLGKTNATNGLKLFNELLVDSTTKLREFTNLSKESQSFNSFANGLNKTATAMKTLDSVTDLTDESLEKLDTVLDKISKSVIQTYEGIQKLGTEESSVLPNFERFSKILDDLSTKMSSIESRFGKTSSSMKNLDTEVNTSKSQFQQLNNQLTTTNTKLSSIDSSSNKTAKSLGYLGNALRTTFSQYVSKAINYIEQSITETYKAKSEMQSWFEVMGMSSTQIDSFNKKLDETVQQFQRVNKYGMGETIASLGVEFSLSEKEMEKAMKTTAMVTNEYLRAGRTSSEANLAIKDILQGQFQRLSRETGVGEKDLLEAGWSGDNTDVMGILNALDKIATSRHWDTMAQKATSINDIWTIFLNKISVGASDLLDYFTPIIVDVFNMLMGVFEKFSDIATSIGEWLNSDGIAQTIIQWTGLATAIGTVVTAFISYRTGASLLQIAQMGLKNTILSTILGLEAETVATYGSRTAILSKITGLELEKASTLSVKQAIASKILGLEAETVAEKGVKAGIIESISARETQILTMQGATASEIENTIATIENGLAQESKIGILSAQVLGLNMTTYAQEGFTVALIESTTQMELSEIVALSLTEQMAILSASFFAPIAIIGAFTLALGMMAFEMNNSAETMKRFNELAKNGEDILKSKRNVVQDYTQKQESLKVKLGETTKYSKEYQRVQAELRDTNRDLVTVNYDLANSLKAVSLATSSQEYYEKKRTEQATVLQGQLADAYQRAGYSQTEAYAMANDQLQEAIGGADQLNEALQRLALADYRRLQTNNQQVEMLKNSGMDKDEIEARMRDVNRAQSMISQGLEKGLTDESFFGSLDGWLKYYEGQILNWWYNFSNTLASGDVYGAIQGAFWGLIHGLAKLPILKDFWNYIFEESGISKFKGTGWEGLATVIGGFFVGLGKTLGNLNIFNILADAVDGMFGDFDIIDYILDNFFVSASDGSSDHPGVAEELNQVIVQPIANWISGFMADPLSYIGAFAEMMPIGMLFTNLFPSDGGASIMNWVNNSIIIPFGQFIYNGIMSIPLVSDILQLFGLVSGDNSGASQKGFDIANAFKTKVEDIVRNIPILGDVLQFLGIIPQANPNAQSNGKGVGDSIKSGVKAGIMSIPGLVSSVFSDAIGMINKYIGDAYNVAFQFADNILKGFKNALHINSPSIISKEILPEEFGENIPNAILSGVDVAYQSAQTYGTAIKDGISSVNNDFSMGGVADEYQQDAQIISTYSQMMGLDTTTAFNDMSLAVNDTTNTMASNVGISYSTMQQKQASLLQNMKTSNTTAYNEMYTKSNQSLLQMRDSTSNITNQMINAWSHMKNQLVATADALKNESTNHFNQLSNTIGSFYRKIQNPSSWGSAGSPNQSSSAPRRRVGRAVASTITGASGGRNSWDGGNTMSISSLKRMICPNGDCGNLFDGYSATDIVDVATFLSMSDGSFGWNGWNKTHYNHIKNKSDQWDMKSPIINLVGGIQTNSKFKVGEFNNGQPKISFGSFQGMAESIFSAIPYKFYYDSSWQGSWLGALQAGACNCYDGASALIAFANSCGFSGYMQHGTWTDADGSTYGHVWAVIDGKKMDTTGWQQRGTWTPSASAGSPNRGSSPNNEVYIYIDMSGSANFGIDDIEDKIEEGVKKGLQEQFSNPTTVVI